MPIKYIPHYFRVILLAIAAFSTQASFAESKINTTFFGKLAIEGYDPVAYFTENKPVEGSKRFTFEWREANWRFSSQENLELFMADPEKYTPQYGGYCAYAISQNKFAGIDPSQFTIVNDKLYLNYNKKINQKWLEDKEQYIIDADNNWPSLLKK